MEGGRDQGGVVVQRDRGGKPDPERDRELEQEEYVWRQRD